MPVANKTTLNLIKNYFNLFNKGIELYSEPNILRIKRLSNHKIFVSKGEFKHTNNKVIINIYVYNRQKYNYLNFLRKINLNLLDTNKLNEIRADALIILNKAKSYKNEITKNTEYKNKFNFYENLYKDNYIIACYQREMLYLYYKRLLLLNKLKFKYTYLQTLINLMKKVYNKNVEFNIVNLKQFYLNSDIYTESILEKITKNRKKLNMILKFAIHKVKIAKNHWMIRIDSLNTKNKLAIINSIDIRKIKKNMSTNNKDPLEKILNNIFSKHEIESNKREWVLNSIKNKSITGVRIEAAGRLSKRHTASRSTFKLRYKGSLRNRDSSYRGLSSIIMRGNMKPNVQYTKLNSIVRIGSFGLKGWISNN